MTRVHIFYSGTVQGVGFRYTVYRLAIGLNLTGWVRNRRSGRVEVLAEGDEKNIKQLIDGIEKHFSDYIREKNVANHGFEGNFGSFEIEATI